MNWWVGVGVGVGGRALESITCAKIVNVICEAVTGIGW
jgi:hypothetical protein